jgi:putative transposase
MERAALRRDFYPFVYRRLQRTGIQFAKSRYWNSALAPLIHPTRMVKVHYHPDNPTCVWVRAEDDILIEAAVVAGVALGEAQRAKLDEPEQARLDSIKLLGYDRGDAIKEGAERRKRQHGLGRATSSAAKQKRQRRAPASGSTPTQPPVPLSRVSVLTEVLDS